MTPDYEADAAITETLAKSPPEERESLHKAWNFANANLGKMRIDETKLSAHRATLLNNAKRSPVRKPVLRLVTWTGIAAAACLLIFVNISRNDSVTIEAGLDQKQVVLPDGSRLELAPNSKLTFSAKNPRSNTLSGSGFFDVVSRSEPFTVRTATAEVRVLGTKFSIQSDGPSATEVFVHEGSVEVKSLDIAERVQILRRGETALVAIATAPKRVDSDGEQWPNWRSASFSFRDKTISAVAQELEEYFGIVIKVSATDDTRYSYVASSPLTLREYLEDICSLSGSIYRPIAGGFEILKK